MRSSSIKSGAANIIALDQSKRLDSISRHCLLLRRSINQRALIFHLLAFTKSRKSEVSSNVHDSRSCRRVHFSKHMSHSSHDDIAAAAAQNVRQYAIAYPNLDYGVSVIQD